MVRHARRPGLRGSRRNPRVGSCYLPGKERANEYGKELREGKIPHCRMPLHSKLSLPASRDQASEQDPEQPSGWGRLAREGRTAWITAGLYAINPLSQRCKRMAQLTFDKKGCQLRKYVNRE